MILIVCFYQSQFPLITTRKRTKNPERALGMNSEPAIRTRDTNRFNVPYFLQVQTETSFQKQLHEATKQLILDASETHNTQQHKTCHRDAQTSPIQTFAEPSFFIAHPSHGDRTAKVDDSLPTRDESLSKDLGEKSGDHYLSSRSVIESPAKRARTKAKSPVNREWRSMRRRVLSLTQQVAGLKTAKESLTKSLNEIKLSNERLQNDLSQSQQRARVSKLTIEVLTIG